MDNKKMLRPLRQAQGPSQHDKKEVCLSCMLKDAVKRDGMLMPPSRNVFRISQAIVALETISTNFRKAEEEHSYLFICN